MKTSDPYYAQLIEIETDPSAMLQISYSYSLSH